MNKLLLPIGMVSAMLLLAGLANPVEAATNETLADKTNYLALNFEETNSDNFDQYSYMLDFANQKLATSKKTVAKDVTQEVAKEIPTVEYEVQSGDNLSSIATAFDLSLAAVLEQNPEITNASLIYRGQKIRMQTEVTLDEGKAKLANPAETAASATTETVAVSTATSAPVAVPTSATGQSFVMESTAYSYQEAGLSNYTAMGIDLSQNPMVIAVDPSVIPLGSRVYVEGYGEAIAGDTGGAIQGNIIDVHFPTVDACYQWGRRSVTVTILS